MNSVTLKPVKNNLKIHRASTLTPPVILNFRNFLCCCHVCIKDLHDQCSSLVENIYQSRPSEIEYWRQSFGSEECNVSGSNATNVDTSDERKLGECKCCNCYWDVCRRLHSTRNLKNTVTDHYKNHHSVGIRVNIGNYYEVPREEAKQTQLGW